MLNAPGVRRVLQFLREMVSLYRVGPVEVTNYQENTTPRLFGSRKVTIVISDNYESDITLDESGWIDEEFMQRVGCVVSPAMPATLPHLNYGRVKLWSHLLRH